MRRLFEGLEAVALFLISDPLVVVALGVAAGLGVAWWFGR